MKSGIVACTFTGTAKHFLMKSRINKDKHRYSQRRMIIAPLKTGEHDAKSGRKNHFCTGTNCKMQIMLFKGCLEKLEFSFEVR